MDILGNSDSKKKKRLNTSGKDEAQNHPLFASLTVEELADPQAIVRAFNEAEKNELQVSSCQGQASTREYLLKGKGSVLFMNLATPKAGSKHELLLLFNESVSANIRSQ
jgi:hypothetical protein